MKQKLFVCAFFIILVGWMVLSFLQPDVYYSKKENRLAAQVPTFSFATYKSREWMEDGEAYLEDQMLFRNTMLDMKYLSESILGKKENNGIFRGKDGFLLKIEDYEEERLEKSFDNIQSILQEKTGSLVLMPTSSYILGDKLPAFREDSVQAAWFEKTKQHAFVVRGDDALRAIQDEGFYRSDHHISMKGNAAVYQLWAKQKGIEPLSTIFTQVYDNFLGSYYRTSSNPFQKGETMDIAQDKDNYITSIVYDETKISTTLYEQSYIAKADAYAMYLDGNHAQTTIHTTSKNKQHLLVLKDSYGNSFVPFLVPHYETITMLDLRFEQDDLTTLLANSDEVIFCYSLAGLQDQQVMKELQKLVP